MKPQRIANESIRFIISIIITIIFALTYNILGLLRNTSLHEDIAHACTRSILNLNWKIVK